VRRGDVVSRKTSKTVPTVMTTLAANLIMSSRLYQMPKPLLMRSEVNVLRHKKTVEECEQKEKCMQPTLIRPARDTDLEGFLDLAKAIGNISGVWGKDPKNDFCDYLKEMNEGKTILLLAIAEHGKIVGFSTVHLFKRLDPSLFDPQSCKVGVAVHSDYRRRRIGTKLIEHGLLEAKKRGIRTVYTSTGIENFAMQKLAEKLGFVKYAILVKNGLKFPRYKRNIR